MGLRRGLSSAAAAAAALVVATSTGVRLASAVRIADRAVEGIVPLSRSVGHAAVAAHVRPCAAPIRLPALSEDGSNMDAWGEMTSGGLITDIETSSSMGLASFFDPETLNTKDIGKLGTPEFRRFLYDCTIGWVSPVHEVPLYVDAERPEERWMITEIPKFTKAKFSVALAEPWNPLAPAMDKEGKFIEYPNPLKWNYGFLPQTWEDPEQPQHTLQLGGDNDPVDVIEISSQAHQYGEATRVKVLGALPLIDKGIADWKIIAVGIEDPLAQKVDSVEDLEREMPGTMDEIREWIVINKKEVSFGLDGAALGVKEALEIIESAHRAWGSLRHDGHTESNLWAHMSDNPEGERPGR